MEQTSLTRVQIHQKGIHAYRKVGDFDQIRDIQAELTESFGDSIEPLSKKDSSVFKVLHLLRPSESARSIVAAQEAGQTVTSAEVCDGLLAGLDINMLGGLTSKVNAFQVHSYRTPRSKGLVGLRLGIDNRHAEQRHALTKSFDEITAVPFPWGHYAPFLPVARLMDREAIEDIRAFRMSRKVGVKLGGLILKRTNSK